MATWTDISKSTSARVAVIDQWWQSQAASGLPDRQQFDPVNFKKELPYLLIVEIRAPFRLYYRLAGTIVVNVAGLNFAGKHLDELNFTGDHEPWTERYRTARDTRRPVYGMCMIDLLNGGAMNYEYGIWPLSNGSHEVQQFLAIEDYASHYRQSRPVLIQASVVPHASVFDTAGT